MKLAVVTRAGMDANPMTLGKIVELIAVAGVVWLLLDGAAMFLGRGAAWAIGIMILTGVAFLFFRRR